uniref:Ig-like domain-containing protein n=1 Tax=Poecilia latipinna TaxID=48699 RepID=A0A3B3W399_9TELE
MFYYLTHFLIFLSDRCCDTVNQTQSTEEGSVTISCPYDSQSVNKLKFFCRGNRPSTCLQQAVITSSNTQDGRFRLSDDRKSGIFTVTISSLTLKDSGSYLCGIQRNSGFDVFTAVDLEVKELESYNISGIEGRPVTLQCPNSGQQHDNRKFLCKGDQHNNCTDMMENQTKFKLLNVSSSCFSVIITELEAADAGTYYCGSDSHAEDLIEVFGYEGRSVTFSCSYSSGYEENEKYLCKNNCGSSDVLITTQQKNDKYSITDDKTNSVVKVTISALRSHDAGKYWCGVSRWGKYLYTEVKLHIKEDRCCDTVNNIQGNEDGSVTISCPYDYHSIDKLKFFCRGNRPSTCLQQAVITSSNTQDGRFRLSDDRKSRIFTVTISSLTLKDSGSYLCGVQRNSGFDAFTAVELEVKELESYNISGIEGRPVTLQCPNSGQQHDNRKFLCKGDQHNNCTDMMENQTKFKLLNVSSSCFSVIITELEAADAGTYYCGSDSQLRFIKIQLAVGETNTGRDRIIKRNKKSRLRFFTTLCFVFSLTDSLHQTSSVAPTSSPEHVTSQPPSHKPGKLLHFLFLYFVIIVKCLNQCCPESVLKSRSITGSNNHSLKGLRTRSNDEAADSQQHSDCWKEK